MSKNLEERVQDVLDIAREPEYYPGWERRLRGACAQVFILGMDVGWDKCVATMDNKFRDSTAKVPDS